MRSRTVGTIIVALGALTLVVSVATTDLFTRTAAFDRLSDQVRPAFSDEALQAQQADGDALEAFASDLPTAIGLLGQQAGLSEAELQAFLARFPQVAAGLETLPAVADGLGTTAATIAAQQDNFASADAIPTDGRSTTDVPWFMVITAVVALGAALLLARGTRRAGVAALAVGVVVVAVPLFTSLPGKSGDADALNTAMRPVFTAATVEQMRTAADALEGFGTELQTQMLPAIATLLETTPQAITDGINQFVPTVGAAIQRAPDAIGRIRASADLLEASIADFQTVQGTSYAPIAWVALFAGVAIVLGALMTMAAREEAAAGMARVHRFRRAA